MAIRKIFNNLKDGALDLLGIVSVENLDIEKFIASFTEISLITPQLATILLTFNTYIGQKKLQRKKIDEYAWKMTDGLFCLGHLAFAKCPDGRWVIINGQHQLEAIVKSGVTVRVSIETFECDTNRDVSILYMQYDAHARSQTDYITAYCRGSGIEWQEDIPIAKMVVGGGAQKNKCQGMEKTEKVKILIDEFVKHGEFVYLIIRTKTGGAIKHMTKAAIICTMLELWEKNPKLAEIFFEGLRHGGFGAGHPITQLYLFLNTHILTQGTVKTHSNDKMVITNDQCRWVIYQAWNAFVSGKTIPPLSSPPRKDFEFPEILSEKPADKPKAAAKPAKSPEAPASV